MTDTDEAYRVLWETHRDHWIKLAMAEGVTLECDQTEPDPCFEFYIKSTVPGRPDMCLMSMLFTWRLAEDEARGLTYGRYWCFPGRDHFGFLAALEQAKRWDADPDSEPQGWIKAWDGRRSG